METNQKENILSEVDELFDRDAKERRVLAQLLERYSNQQGKYLATRGEMGTHHAANNKTFRTPSFVVSHDLNWIATNLKMGSEMPFMQNYINEETGHLEIDASNVEDLKQRQPDWSRQAALTAYLLSDKTRKFGTILAVISPDWVDNAEHEYWGMDGRALRSAANFDTLDVSGRVGMLNLENTLVYALDGQHRVMGLRGIKDLLENNFRLKNRSGDEVKRIGREEFLGEYGVDVNVLQTMMSERMHVEYIPAVLPGETRNEGSRRVRSVFVAINSQAKMPKKGENYLLDEIDGYALVARRVGVSHPIFKGNGKSRINWKSSALPERSEWYTTLEALKDMTQNFLFHSDKVLAKAWTPPFGLKDQTLRPSEEALDSATNKVKEFFDRVWQLPVFQTLERSNNLPLELGNYRAFPEKTSTTEHGHLLLRPIGQIILANAVGQLVGGNPEKQIQPMTLDDIFSAITLLDKNGRFEAHLPTNVWYGVTYNFHKNKMDTGISNRELAVDLLIYLIQGADEVKRRELLQKVIKYREIEGQWRSFNGGKMLPIDRDSDGAILVKDHNLPLPKN
jgi:DGQHR domain-containing protein